VLSYHVCHHPLFLLLLLLRFLLLLLQVAATRCALLYRCVTRHCAGMAARPAA
jgi:hypothetical protein